MLRVSLVLFEQQLQVYSQIKKSRSDAENLFKRITSRKRHNELATRRMVSMNVCGIGLLCDFIGGIFRMLSPTLRMLGMNYSFLPEIFDALMIFVVVPLAHLLNEEDTKTLLAEKKYNHAFKKVFSLK